MDKLIRYQRGIGTQQLTAVVLTENRRMRKLAEALGFRETETPNDETTLQLLLELQQPARQP